MKACVLMTYVKDVTVLRQGTSLWVQAGGDLARRYIHAISRYRTTGLVRVRPKADMDRN